MMKVLRHGDQILRMTQSMKINACTILYNSLVEYQLQRIFIFLRPSPFTVAHASWVRNHHQVSSTSRILYF